MSHHKLTLDINSIKFDRPIRIAVVQSLYNLEITQGLVDGIQARLSELKHLNSQISVSVHPVPGAVEIPLVADRLASTDEYDAIIACGAIIRGETFHFECVCQILVITIFI